MRARALVAAVQPEGSADVVMLVGLVDGQRVEGGGAERRAMARRSFRIAKLRKTSIASEVEERRAVRGPGRPQREKARDNVMNGRVLTATTA